MRLTAIEKKVLAGFAATFVILVVMAVGAAFSIRAFVSASRWVTHTYDVLQAFADVQAQVQGSELHTRAYLLTGNESRLAQRDLVSNQLAQSLASVLTLTRDNRNEQIRGALLSSDVDKLRAIQQRLIAARNQPASDHTPARAEMERSYQQLQQINALLQSMRLTEKQLLDQRIYRAHSTAINTVVIFAVLVCFMLAIKLYLFKRISFEVAERERVDADLLEAKQVLEATNKELESFSYSISHDLRSPLRAVNGFARILDSEYGPHFDEEGRRIIGVILRSSDKMNMLIDDLLAFSRVGRSVLNKTDIDMQKLVEKARAELLLTGEYQTVNFTLERLPNAAGDPALLSQVWTNLLSNACKYSSKNPAPRVVVTGEDRDGEVIYTVSDNGVGFDMRYYHKLFGVFQRLHSDSEFHGTGVGLAIIQRIVTRHGGRVWAEAAPGQGATFFFALPRR